MIDDTALSKEGFLTVDITAANIIVIKGAQESRF